MNEGGEANVRAEVAPHLQEMSAMLERVENTLAQFGLTARQFLERHEQKFQGFENDRQEIDKEFIAQQMLVLAYLEEIRALLSQENAEEEVRESREDEIVLYPEPGRPSGEEALILPESESSPHESGVPEPGPPESALSLGFIRQLAWKLGLYYMDQVTPHLVFVRTLITHAESSDPDYLTTLLVESFHLKPGENLLELWGNLYRIWKK
jgi:hypothetical protein